MRLYRAKDYNDMSRKAAHIISAQVTMKPDCVLGLATGSTPIGTYKQLIEWYNNGDLDFAEVKTANLDEYKGLTRDNDQSYYYFMHENLFKHVNIKEENTNIPDGTEPDAAKECARYEKVVHELGGVDLQLLGLGHNGHIGFNEREVDVADLHLPIPYTADVEDNAFALRVFHRKNLVHHIEVSAKMPREGFPLILPHTLAHLRRDS